MCKSITAFLAAALLWQLTTPFGAWAVDLKIDEITAVPYTDLVIMHSIHQRPTGLVEKHTPPAGKVLWLVNFAMTPEWDELTENFSVEDESFGLFDGDTKVEHLGSMSSFGVIDRYLSAPYMYRSDNWKTEPANKYRKSIWVYAPQDKKELTLKLNQLIYNKEDMNAPPKKTPYSAVVKLSDKTPKPFDMNDFAEVRIRAVKMLDSVEEKDEYNRNARAKKVVNEGGSILQLTLQITPKAATAMENVSNEKAKPTFEWSPGWFGLSFGKGGRSVCAGTKRNGVISPDQEESIEMTDSEIWDSKTVAFYFPVPSNLKSFDITMLGQTVGSGTVPAP